jgi:hypothetical protein
MERRFRVRLDELLGDAVVAPEIPRGLLPRLERFLEPFLAALDTPEEHCHAHHYVAGLLSDLDHKTAEGIAYLHDQGCQGLQKFLGQAPWDERPFVTELVRQVGADLGEPDGVLVFDPSARKAPLRWGCSGSGAVAWAKSITARSASTSATPVASNTPWWTVASSCPGSGSRTRIGG